MYNNLLLLMKKILLLLSFLWMGVTPLLSQIPDGTVAPNFTVTNVVNNQSYTLYNLLDQGKTVYLDFFATWCGPCKMVGPILEGLKTDLGEGIRIYKIDVDQNPSLASQYNVRSVPTLMIFKNGKLQWRESGVRSKVELKKVIQSMNESR